MTMNHRVRQATTYQRAKQDQQIRQPDSRTTWLMVQHLQPPVGARSSSVVTLSQPPTLKSPISHFAMHHLISGINFLSLPSALRKSLLMMSHSLVHLPPAHHSHHPIHHTFTHSFIPSSKLAFSTNLFHHSLLAPTGLPSRTILDRT